MFICSLNVLFEFFNEKLNCFCYNNWANQAPNAISRCPDPSSWSIILCRPNGWAFTRSFICPRCLALF